MDKQLFGQFLKKMAGYCAYQERSLFEVDKKMNDLQIPEHFRDAIIDHLYEDNYLNEERFLFTYISSKFRQLNWGKQKIRQGLYHHKISAKDIENALDRVISKEDYQNTIRSLYRKKLSSITDGDPRLKQKIYAFLAGKGYSFSDISEAIDVTSFED
jgi:regulatory protein